MIASFVRLFAKLHQVAELANFIAFMAGFKLKSTQKIKSVDDPLPSYKCTSWQAKRCITETLL
jgi:hypothetical protein